MTNMAQYLVPIVLIGDGGVGKTSLIEKFVKNTFSDNYISTIGCKTSKKTISLGEHELNLMIKDVPGQDTFSNLNKSNFRGVKGALVVYDSTRKNTFESIDRWIENLYSVTGDVPVCIIGNKHDILDSFEKTIGVEAAQNAPKEEFEKYINENFPQVAEFYKRHPEFGTVQFQAVPYYTIIKYANGRNKFQKKFNQFQSSAMNGENVETAFANLGEQILEKILEVA